MTIHLIHACMTKILSKNSKYIGNTEPNLCVQLEEHNTNKGSSVFNNISDCANYQCIKNLYCIDSNSFDAYMDDKNYIPELKIYC